VHWQRDTSGVYFFSQAVNKEEAEEEAQFVLERIRDYDIKGPVVYDTEEIKNDTARTDDLDGKAFTDHCITFLRCGESGRIMRR